MPFKMATRHRASPIAFIAGALLVFVGSARALPALYQLGSAKTIEDMQAFSPVSAPAIDKLLSALRGATEIYGTALDWSRLGLALATKGAQTDDEHRTAFFKDARDALVRSLELAPANPYAWARLATIDLSLDAAPDLVLKEWRMSVMTGPNEDRLDGSRFDLAIKLWPDLEAADREVVFSEIRRTWSRDKWFVLTESRDKFSANVIRAALAVNIQDLLEFEKLRRDNKIN